jgi:hypothetical protein
MILDSLKKRGDELSLEFVMERIGPTPNDLFHNFLVLDYSYCESIIALVVAILQTFLSGKSFFFHDLATLLL